MPITFAALTVLASLAVEPEAVAKDVATKLGLEQFGSAVALFDNDMGRSLTEDRLRTEWGTMVRGLGTFKQVGGLTAEPHPSGKAFVVDLVYERGSFKVRVVVNEQGRVSGLRPAAALTGSAAEAAARELAQAFEAQDVAKLQKVPMTPEMARVPLAKLMEAWKTHAETAGALNGITGARVEPSAFIVVDLDCVFAKGPGTVRVVFSNGGKLAGLFFRPSWTPPDYAQQDTFTETAQEVGTKPFLLPATLTLPKGAGPFPVVVLVHGSGPNDADETIGPNKLFKDLAWGLASQKVAVLRFQKRTFQYRGRLTNNDIKTVKDESIDDTVSAIALLSKTKGIDPKRIFVAGHSLGGSLAPRIALAEPKVKGLVLLAGATRPMGQMIAEQTKYLVGQKPEQAESPGAKKAVAEAERTAARFDTETLKDTDVVEGLLGSYLLDLRAHAGTADAARVKKPMLVLQGERDYQVTLVDLDVWKKGLAGRKDVTFKSYPTLNHFFMPGTGASSPLDYDSPNHALKEVVDDVAKWVTTH